MPQSCTSGLSLDPKHAFLSSEQFSPSSVGQSCEDDIEFKVAFRVLPWGMSYCKAADELRNVELKRSGIARETGTVSQGWSKVEICCAIR